MSKPTPTVVVPFPGQPALAVVPTRNLRSAIGQEILAGIPCGLTVDSAVSLLVAGYVNAFCFDAEAASGWEQALVFAGQQPADFSQQFSGPFFDRLKAKREAAAVVEVIDTRPPAVPAVLADTVSTGEEAQAPEPKPTPVDAPRPSKRGAKTPR
jgi:hypothetical protein